ncbi:sigma-70 family RNA polymerase sigma factor [uncultured Paraglaciecola sp.]|uniref:sigma-70 family RNA polymerase sigma factor n=1 Tax=uncultured Paraglaciecola sp. TaxID=1765024 RepID=UPI00261E20C1|nr:sigma-70 family RNA polymerase sigma factor [uncultured Paraglaciecola sp.]
MDNNENLKLLGKVAAGDRRAFEQLYAATSGQLFAVSLKILGRKDRAEDVLQDAFIRIWHNAGEFTPGRGTVLTWMISIVRYRAFDLIRYHKVRGEDGTESTEFSAEDDLQELPQQQKNKLEFCLKELESQQQQAIHLAFFRGLTHKEVTRHTNNPLGTTKSLIRRAMQSLKRCLGL